MFQRLTPMVKNLLIITVAVYYIPQLLGLGDFGRFLGLWSIASPFFMPYQFFTYMFAHAGFWHLFGNMLGLYFLGTTLEQFWGSKRFLIFYMVTGIGAGVLYAGIKYISNIPMKNAMEEYVVNPNSDDFYIYLSKYDVNEFSRQERFIDYYATNNSKKADKDSVIVIENSYLQRSTGLMLGASGAIYAILMAFGLLFPNTQMIIFPLPIPIKAKYLVMAFGGYAIYSLFKNNSGDQVAHLAHLTGMIFGFIMIKLWDKDRNNFY